MQVVAVSPSREIHVQRKLWRGREFLDIRTYIKTENYEGYTKKGVMIPIEMADDLVGAIVEEIE